MWRLPLAVAASVVMAGSAAAQSISPPIAEYEKSTTSRLEIRNPGLYPVTVVVEPQGFQLDAEGTPTFGPLPESIRLRLSETSFQVAPQGQHYVYYQVDVEETPVWFILYATMNLPRGANGIQLRLKLPHTVYVYGDPLRESDVEVEAFSFDPSRSEVLIDLVNTGPRLGRVQVGRLQRDGADVEIPGFPLFPDSGRTLRIPWSGDDPPSSLTLELGAFRLERAMTLGDRIRHPD